jgi:serine/threonine-protein kinase RsbW
MAKPRVALDLEIPSDVKYIEHVVELATRQCRELHLPPHKCSLNVPVALTEALSNAILRGNAKGKGKIVRVRALISDDALIFDVSDEGPDFDIEKERVDPTPENLTREEGRGLFLMYQLMDRVEHKYNRGNVVRLTLRRRQ